MELVALDATVCTKWSSLPWITAAHFVRVCEIVSQVMVKWKILWCVSFLTILLSVPHNMRDKFIVLVVLAAAARVFQPLSWTKPFKFQTGNLIMVIGLNHYRDSVRLHTTQTSQSYSGTVQGQLCAMWVVINYSTQNSGSLIANWLYARTKSLSHGQVISILRHSKFWLIIISQT